MSTTVLVTGASGFLGSAVVRHLVRCFDSGLTLWDGSPISKVSALLGPSNNQERLQELPRSKVWSLETVDISDFCSFAALLKRLQPRVVLHLAATGVAKPDLPQEEADRVNVRPLEVIFEVLSQIPDSRFIHTSSMWVLGPGTYLDETAKLEPRTSYARSKADADRLLPQLGNKTGVEWINLRLFNVFGAYEPSYRLIPYVVSKLSENQPAELSSGTQLRDFNDVDTIACAYRLALEVGSEACGQTYHLGCGKGLTVRQVANHIGEILGKKDLLWFRGRALRPGEQDAWVSNPTRAKKMLHWNPDPDPIKKIEESVSWWQAVRRSVESTQPTFSIIMPCYNEEENLPLTIPPLFSVLDHAKLSYEIILVDNGSRDSTSQVIDKLAEKHPVRKNIVTVNQGYGFGILTGLQEARGEFIGYMCPDGQIRPEDVRETLLTMKEKGKGTVTKVRRVKRGDGLKRLLVSKVYNTFFFLLFGRVTSDVNGTPKMLHRDDLKKIDPGSKDWFIDAEIMIQAKRIGLKVKEIPVLFHKREIGKSNIRLTTALEFVRNMLAYRLGLARGRERKKQVQD